MILRANGLRQVQLTERDIMEASLRKTEFEFGQVPKLMPSVLQGRKNYTGILMSIRRDLKFRIE